MPSYVMPPKNPTLAMYIQLWCDNESEITFGTTREQVMKNTHISQRKKFYVNLHNYAALHYASVIIRTYVVYTGSSGFHTLEFAAADRQPSLTYTLFV